MALSSCLSSALAILRGKCSSCANDEEAAGSLAPALHSRLLAGLATMTIAPSSSEMKEKEEESNLAREVRALESALAEAERAREAAEALRLDAERCAEAAEARLRTAVEGSAALAEALRCAVDAQESRDARIRELEERIRDLNNAASKWRFF